MSNEFVMVPRELAERIATSIGYEERDELREILDKPAEQHQGEPVAWRYQTHAGGLWYLSSSEQNARMFENAEKGSRVEPLYTHADPGEVERLENLIGDIQGLRLKTEAELEDLRAKLSSPQQEPEAYLSRLDGGGKQLVFNNETTSKIAEAYGWTPLYAGAEVGEVKWLREEIEDLRSQLGAEISKCNSMERISKKQGEGIDTLLTNLAEMTTFRDNAANHMNRIRDEATAFEKERDDLRAQLAERDALLRSTVSMLYSISARLLDFHADKPEQWCGYLDDALGGTKHQISELEKSISASAEPSAPVERDELG